MINPLKEFEQMKTRTQEEVSANMQELMKYCNEDEDVAEFVRLVTYPMLHPEEYMARSRSEEYRVGNQLSTFIYKLDGTDIHSATTNKYHFNAGWISELNGFIGNFFYDDAYYKIEQTGVFKTWEVSGAGDDWGVQGPLVLIAAARDIAKFHTIEDDVVSEKISKAEWKVALMNGMQSSGEVERLIEPYKHDES